MTMESNIKIKAEARGKKKVQVTHSDDRKDGRSPTERSQRRSIKLRLHYSKSNLEIVHFGGNCEVMQYAISLITRFCHMFSLTRKYQIPSLYYIVTHQKGFSGRSLCGCKLMSKGI